MRITLLSLSLVALAHCTTAAPSSPDAGAVDVPLPNDLGSRDDVADATDATKPADSPEPVDVLELPTPTDHCRYEPVAPTARAGGTVTEGAVSAGTAELPLDLPVGSALGAYTSRVRALGNDGALDDRDRTLAGWFNASLGYETRPMVRALALTAGDETVLLLKADIGVADETILGQVTARLGPAYAGKVLFLTSHSHSAPGHTVAHEGYGILGFGPARAEGQRRLVDALVQAALAAVAARVPLASASPTTAPSTRWTPSPATAARPTTTSPTAAAAKTTTSSCCASTPPTERPSRWFRSWAFTRPSWARTTTSWRPTRLAPSSAPSKSASIVACW